MTVKLLSELENGEKGRIIKIGVTGSIRRRLTDMGLVSGSEVRMERVAPLGDPIEIKLMGYDLSLRKEVASKIEVEVIMATQKSIPLTKVAPGKLMTVTGFRGGFGLQRRLADMGLTPGVQIRVISSEAHGPVLIDLRGSRLALGYGEAQKTMVKEG